MDTAGTEAVPEVPARSPGTGPALADPTRHPQGAPDEGEDRGSSDPSSLHRAEDDGKAFASSPEFHDRPGSGRHAGVEPHTPPDTNAELPPSGTVEPE